MNLEMRQLGQLQRNFGPVPLGDVPPLAVLVEAIILAGLIIFLPLRRLKKTTGDSGTRWLDLIYFSLLGVGFIAIEVVLLQRYVFFVGAPTTAMSVVLGSLLVWAGLGSAVVSPLMINRPRLIPYIFGAITVMAAIGAFGLGPFFNEFLHLGLLARCALGVIVLAPLGLLMGSPFPTGLRLVHRQDRRAVAWAWALNGYWTVIGTTAVGIVIPLLGYRSMFLIGGLFYLLAGICLVALVRRGALAGRGRMSRHLSPNEAS